MPIEKDDLQKIISETLDSKLSEFQKEQSKNYSHPPFAIKESGDKTNVTYEAARQPTNAYDVEIAKLEFEQWKMGRPGRIVIGIGVIVTLGLAGLGIYKVLSSKEENK